MNTDVSILRCSGDVVLEDYSFKDCSELKSVVLSGRIGVGVFENCGNLTRVEITEGVSTILDDTFKNCGIIDEVLLPPSLLNITINAFSDSNVRVITGYRDTLAEELAKELGCEFNNLGDLN